MIKFISNVYCILPFASDATMSTCWQGREKISPEQTMHPGRVGGTPGHARHAMYIELIIIWDLTGN